jgi:hypothetical protein
VVKVSAEKLAVEAPQPAFLGRQPPVLAAMADYVAATRTASIVSSRC